MNPPSMPENRKSLCTLTSVQEIATYHVIMTINHNVYLTEIEYDLCLKTLWAMGNEMNHFL